MDDHEDRYQRITLRIPKDLHTKLMSEAEAKSRSMNAEIIDRLHLADQEHELELLTLIHSAQDNYISALERVIKTSDSHAKLFAEFLMDLIVDLRAASMVPANFKEKFNRLFMMAKELITAGDDRVREAVEPGMAKAKLKKSEAELTAYYRKQFPIGGD